MRQVHLLLRSTMIQVKARVRPPGTQQTAAFRRAMGMRIINPDQERRAALRNLTIRPYETGAKATKVSLKTGRPRPEGVIKAA
jgi:hypothetical protein